jgi:LmbE family N-acetylglucosaminyl deacetylase
MANNRHRLDRLPNRLLGVWAHPDDEAYLSAGLMARMVDAGHDVTVVTATRGEKGTDDPALFGSATFAVHREQELRRSLGELGVTDLRMLGHADGDCDLVAPDSAVEAIAAVMREIRPEVVITFGPDGITGHPDHRAVSSWTTEAWLRVGHGDLRYATMTDRFVMSHADLHDEIGIFAEYGLDGPFSVTAAEIVAEYDLADIELDRKRRALAAHASQTEHLAALVGADTYRTWWRTESFRRPTTTELSSCPAIVRWMDAAEAVAA